MAQHQDQALQRQISTLIFHRISDEVMPIQASRDFAAIRPWVKLIKLDSGALSNVMPQIWQEIQTFL